LKAESIADNGAAVVILNCREPGLGRLSCFIEQQDVKGGVIGLPHCVGMRCFAPVEQIKRFAVRSGSLMSKGDQSRIEILDNLTDAVIAGRCPPLFFGNGTDLAMNGGHRTGRGL
jgi:hypothetical protein